MYFIWGLLLGAILAQNKEIKKEDREKVYHNFTIAGYIIAAFGALIMIMCLF